MFDPEKTGFVCVKDLETIMACLGRDSKEAGDLVDGMQRNDKRLSFMDFLGIMKILESRLISEYEKPKV